MKDGYKRIFWGLFIVTFNIKLGIITILPAFVGWIAVSTGLSEFSRANTRAMILIIITLLGSLISILGGPQIETSILFSFFPLLAMSIELSLFHRMLEASIHNFQALELMDLVEKYSAKDRRYIILMGITMVILVLALTIVHDVLVFLAGASGTITRIYLLYIISSMGKEDYKGELIK